MSPMVERLIKTEVGPTRGVIEKYEKFYCSPDELAAGDKIVEPSPKQLNDLRVTHPEEVEKYYGHLLGKGQKAAAPLPQAEPPRTLSPLKWEQAVAAIRLMDDKETLAGWFAEEEERDPAARPSVLQAFKEKGIE